MTVRSLRVQGQCSETRIPTEYFRFTCSDTFAVGSQDVSFSITDGQIDGQTTVSCNRRLYDRRKMVRRYAIACPHCRRKVRLSHFSATVGHGLTVARMARTLRQELRSAAIVWLEATSIQSGRLRTDRLLRLRTVSSRDAARISSLDNIAFSYSKLSIICGQRSTKLYNANTANPQYN